MRVPTFCSRRGTRTRTPTVLQMEAVECGAAALASVLGYYGRIVSLEELRVACGVSRDGTKASNILKAARSYGLKAKAFSRQASELADLPVPMIVFWNFNHFVVVEGLAPEKVYLNDPAMGPRTVGEAEFTESFTGVVLIFEPGENFKPGGVRRGLLGPLRERLRGSEGSLTYVLAGTVMLAGIGLAIPLAIRAFVDYCVVAGRGEWAGPLLLGMVLAAGLRGALTWLQRRYLLRLETKLALTSSYRYFHHVLRLPMEFFTQRYGGEVGNRVEINDHIAGLLSGKLAANFLNLVMAICYLALMFRFDVVLAAVGSAIAALNLVALRYVSRGRQDVNMRLLHEQGKMLGTSLAGLQSIETLKASGAESDFFSRWAAYLAKVTEAGQQMSRDTLMLGLVPFVLGACNTIAILGIGAGRVLDGYMTVGMLVAFQSLMSSFMEPVEQLLWMGSSLQEVKGELNRLDDVLRYPPDANLDRQRTAESDNLPPRLAGHVELRGITFGHSRLDPPLIDGFSVSIPPGARIALVGPSGSGKTTLAKVVSGINRPWSGEILLDGIPWEQVPRDVLTNTLSMVDQEFFLIEGSVREVLTLWDATVSEDVMVQAAKDACIHDDIAARAGGYDSHVEEAGANFSGGQRQRLEIARALVTNPAVLVLDEATSALDPITEKTIDDHLRRRGCTCIIVAHRLSTIRDCDEIIVMDRGRIVQRGTHDTLYQASGLYRDLVQS